MGNRLRATYYTREVALVNPACTTIPGTDNLQEYNIVSYTMLGNKRYIKLNDSPWFLDKVMNDEGYTRFELGDEDYPFYYIKDHLGNIRETYVRTSGNKFCAQRMQYYPSGLPWDESQGASYQPFKYGGKEFVEMHGLDEYDSEARWYYPAIMRTTTMDPMCEKYYSTSPYAWCGNNPVNYVDPDGMDWFYIVDSLGNKEYYYLEDVFCQQDLKDLNINGTYVGMTTEDEDNYYGLFGYKYSKNDGTISAAAAKLVDELLIGDAKPRFDNNTGEDLGEYKMRFVIKGLELGEMKEFEYAGGEGIYHQMKNNKLHKEQWNHQKERYGGYLDKNRLGYFLFISNTTKGKQDFYPVVIDFKTSKRNERIYQLYLKTVYRRFNGAPKR